ncbi:MAG: 30S ribosomal protein S20 [Lentisphaeria bacterium]
MPNSKSAEKRVRQNEKNNSRNRRRMKAVRQSRKQFEALLQDKKVDEARTALKECYSALDRAGKHNTISPKKATRLKSRLARNLDTAASA